MATTILQPARIEAPAPANPLARWHLLSLDAPTVASVWTCFIARANGIRLPVVTVAAMFFAVWVLYVADRLLDARILSDPRAYPSPGHTALEARHLFHHSHRVRFAALAAAALAAIAFLIPRLNPAALRLFAAEGLLLAAWFLTLHATPFARHLPKELALGPFFAAAISIPTVVRLDPPPFHLFSSIVLFAAVCSLNCLLIHRWESPFSHHATHVSTRVAARFARPAAAAVVMAGVASALFSRGPALAAPAACALAAALLLLLDRNRSRFDRTTLRAAADLALLTPLLLLPFMP